MLDHGHEAPSGGTQVNKDIVKSLTAVASGWAIAFAGGFATMLVIAICNPEGFTRREAAVSTGSLLVSLLVSIPWSAIGGSVTARLARRNEIKHGIGLILFTSAAYACFCLLRGHESDAIQTPIWFHVAWQVSLVPSVLLGAWLQMRRRTLPQTATTGVAGVINDLWLSIRLLMDPFRLPITVVLCFVIALGGTWLGTLLMAVGIRVGWKLLGSGRIDPGVDLLCVAVSFFVSCLLARRVFRRIMTQDCPVMKKAE
jgi:hypothetical protein